MTALVRDDKASPKYCSDIKPMSFKLLHRTDRPNKDARFCIFTTKLSNVIHDKMSITNGNINFDSIL